MGGGGGAYRNENNYGKTLSLKISLDVLISPECLKTGITILEGCEVGLSSNPHYDRRNHYASKRRRWELTRNASPKNRTHNYIRKPTGPLGHRDPQLRVTEMADNDYRQRVSCQSMTTAARSPLSPTTAHLCFMDASKAWKQSTAGPRVSYKKLATSHPQAKISLCSALQNTHPGPQQA